MPSREISASSEIVDYRAMEEGFTTALKNGRYFRVGEQGGLEQTSRVHFDMSPHRLRGLSEGVSGHGVFFGEIHETTSGKSQMVAVKAHGTMDDVRAEITGGKILEELGFPVYSPVAAVEDENRAYLLTAFNPDLITLNEVEWKPLADGVDEPQYVSQRRLIEGCARSLAALHVQARATHGDAQIKNFAVHRSWPGVCPVDPEKIQRDLDPISRANKALDDLVTLKGSLVRSSTRSGDRFYHGVGVWGRLNGTHVSRLTDQMIVGPYIDRAAELSGRRGDEDTEFLDPMVNLIMDGLL